MSCRSFLFGLAIVLTIPGLGCNQIPPLLVVEAGDYDRQFSIVSIEIPPGYDELHLLAVDGNAAVPVQRVGNIGLFNLESLSAGDSALFYVVRGNLEENETTIARFDTGKATLEAGGREVFTYNFDEVTPPSPDTDPIYTRGGYIHPVLTPSGRRVTGDYPYNHIHHHGIWGAWTNTVFQGRTPDFWNMGEGTGTVVPGNFNSIETGSVFSGFNASHTYVDLSADEPVSVLRESWEARLYFTGDSYNTFDMWIHQEALTDSTLLLPEYRYGGLGFRGRIEWDGPDSTYFLTSEGRDRSDGHATRARWCHISGEVDGMQAGVAIFSHPVNFRHPEPMRIHPTEPFFNWAPSQAGDWVINRENPFMARYRFIALDGPPNPELLDQLWNDWAHPVETTVIMDPSEG